MNKVIEQSQQTQIIKICYGNDFGLSVSINVWNADTSAWDKLDLSAATDVEMFLVAQNGKRIKTNTTVDNESNIVTQVPATYLSKTTYAVEITFKLDSRNRRTYSPCMIQIVNNTDEAGFSTQEYVTNDTYHFDILVKNDVAWLNIGSLPSEYVTEEELSDVLTSYATISSVDNQINALWQDASNTFIDDSELATALSSYATKSYVDSALEPYATTSYVSSYYYDKTDVDNKDEAVKSYVNNYYYDKTEVDSKDEAVKSYVNNYYYDKAEVDNKDEAVKSYVNNYYYDKTEVDSKDEAVKSYVSSHYYDKTFVDTTFNSYVNAADYDSNTKHINLKNGNTVISYIDAADFVIDGMVDFAYVDNGYLMIIFNTDAGHEDIAIPISDIFDANNYYNRTDVDNLLSSYVTETDLSNASYVTSTDLSNASYVTSQDLDTTLATASYVTETDLANASYVTSQDLDTTLANASYATVSYVETTYGYLDTRVTYLEQHGGGGGGGTVPSNVVTSYDGTYIYCLSQQEYDDLETNSQLDTYTFYYIEGESSSSNYVTQAQLSANSYVTETFLNNQSYATQQYVQDEIAQSGGGSAPSNMVTTDTQQTITGQKTFEGETHFNYDYALYYTDIFEEVNKSSCFARGSFNQLNTGEIIAPNTAVQDGTCNINDEVDKIKFYKTTGEATQKYPYLTQLAAIDDSGIYEGTTLLANKYVQSTDIRNIVQITQNDYNNLGTPDINTLYVIV